MLHVLGLSFGKKNANSDILCKEALFGAREAFPDAEIKFINTVRLKVDRCIGCGACSTALEHGKDNKCVVKDDFQMLENWIRWADAIILAAPVYALQPVGQFKNLVDRYSCRHDTSAINWVLDKRRSGEMPGNPDDFPLERLRVKTVSYISVGGASTEDWTSMGTCSLHIFGFPTMMNVVSNYNANSMGTIGNPYLKDELIEHMHEIGKRTAQAYGKDKSEIEYYNPKDGDGICPVCHQRLLTIERTGTNVTCPVCGTHGTLSIEDGQIKVNWPASEFERARGTFKGLREHTTEIQGFGAICGPKIMANKAMLDEKMDSRIKKFDEAAGALTNQEADIPWNV